MKKFTSCSVLVLSLSLMGLVFSSGIGMAQHRDKAPDVVNYVNPRHFSEYTFKFDKSKGFKLKYRFTAKDFKGKMPERIEFYFYGPQPVNVQAWTVSGCIKERLTVFPRTNGMFWIHQKGGGSPYIVDASPRRKRA